MRSEPGSPGLVNIQPVIFLGIDREGLPLEGKAGELAVQIRERARSSNYLRIEGGYYVPLIDLIGHLAGLAEYLYEDTVYSGQFEIGGGLKISTWDGISLSLPPRASFRLALTLADILVNLPGNETRKAYLSPAESWRVTRQSTVTRIETPRKVLEIPSADCIAAAQEAVVQMYQFAGRISPLLLTFQDSFITDAVIRSVFGFRD